MSYRVIVRPLAERDITEAQLWYDEQRKELGREFREEVGHYTRHQGGRRRIAWTTMSTQHAAVDKIAEKIRELSPDKRAEVEDFVDFLRLKDEEQGLAQAAAKLSEEAFERAWNNPEDAEYDRL